jgi:hypothetical protein
MLIKDLLEALISPEIKKLPRLPQEYDLPSLKKLRDTGSNRETGRYSKGDEGNDPHEYKLANWLPTRLKHDAKYHWIKSIRPYMGDNPYIPIYYNIHYEKDKDGKTRMKYNMEKLVSLFRLSQDERQALAAKTFNNDEFYNMPDIGPKQFANILSDVVYDIHLGRSPRYEIDSDLKQALVLINNLLERGFTDDLHGANIMVRNTSMGYHLVITDPVQDDGDSIIEK